ncbi:MAG: hypothetical protein U0Q18_03105 [Bryobacteraceae bacterium]
MTARNCFGWVGLLLVAVRGFTADRTGPPTKGPSREAIDAFDEHSRAAESRLQKQLQGEDGFLWANTAERRAIVRKGGVSCQPGVPHGEVRISHGLIHDWVGAVYIPHATVNEVLALVQDYDNHKNVYKPEVIDSKTLSRQGDDFKIRLRLLKKKVLTVVLETEHEVHYERLDPVWWRSRSYSTRIAEVENYGEPRERERPPGQDRGFLWRLNSYWTFRERDGGTYVECEAISLTRSVPAALRWLIDPIVQSLARESLVHTLQGTQAAVLKSKTDSARVSGS